MAKANRADEQQSSNSHQAPVPPPPPPVEEHDVPRMGNVLVKPKSITIRETLTKPLTSITYEGNMVIECVSEIYSRPLPVNGRSEKPVDTELIDVINWTDTEDPQEQILILNEVAKQAMIRTNKPLTGQWFALTSGEIREGKKYRMVDVKRLDVER